MPVSGTLSDDFEAEGHKRVEAGPIARRDRCSNRRRSLDPAEALASRSETAPAEAR
jgi:hypothetical protein